jgi:hypothetical protein
VRWLNFEWSSSARSINCPGRTWPNKQLFDGFDKMKGSE